MIRRRSPKRAKQEREYSRLRKQFLEVNPICQAGLPGCHITSSQVHHQAGRIGDRLTDVNNFLAVCASCHEAIEHSPKMAREKGFSKSRLKIEQ